VRRPKLREGGFYPWTEDDIARFEQYWPIGTMARRALGRGPFSPDGFYSWFRKCCREAGVTAAATSHGLRKACCRRLAEAGCSAAVIAAISGHKSLREVQRYIDSADQVKLARQGIEAITRTKVATLSIPEWLPERKAE
jgi:integrase